MKKSIIIMLFGIIATTANAQFLFKISKGNMGKPSYILGRFIHWTEKYSIAYLSS